MVPPFLPTMILLYVSVIHISTHMERSSSHNVASFLLLFSPSHPTPSKLPFKLPKLRLVFAAQSDSGADLDQFA